MKSNSLTIKDIATSLNLSYSTVARALKDSYMISEPVRKKVQEYAAQHNYKPNLMAQSLRSNKSRSIGIILPAISNRFFVEVLSGIESVSYEKGYKLMITQSYESSEREIKNIEHLAWHSVDGLIISLASETTDISHLKKIQEEGVALVFVDRVTALIKAHSVSADNLTGAYEATLHLVKNGYKKIGHITSSPELSITKERAEGYYKALMEANISIDKNYIKHCDHGGMLEQEIEKAVDEIFANNNPPDALLTASDRITIGVLSILDKRGIKIPDEVAVAGFSNFSAPQLFNPSLTTVMQPAFEMGKKAVELLIAQIEHKQPVVNFEKVVLPTELIIRKSSARRNS